MKRKMIFLTLFSLLVLSSCEMNNTPNNPTGETAYYGETRMLGQGTVKSWVKLDNATNNPTSVGVTISESALSGLPTTDTDINLQLPSQANKTVFNAVGFDWGPQGHPPTAIYGVPHFDIHFFMLSSSDRMMISGNPSDSMNAYMAPMAGYLPEGYFIVPGSAAEGEGAHAVDSTGSEFHGHSFTEVVVYGFYKGKMAFIEPMVTLAYLQSKQPLNVNLKLPQYYSMTGYYPTKLSITYDATAKEYNIALTNMVYRMATQ